MKSFLTYFTSNQFNFVNTFTYAILILVVVYFLYKLLFNKIKIKFDFKFFLALFPYILFGSTLRALVDNKYIVENFWTITPGIWILTASLFIPTYLICFYLSKKFKFKVWKVVSTIGVIFLLIILGINRVKFHDSWIFFVIIGLAILISIILHFTFRLLKQKEFTKKLAFLPIFSHMVDASATFIAVDFFNGWEKHPVTRMFTNFTGTAASFYILKLLVVIPAVYLIIKEIKDKNFRNFLLIILATIGLAEGLRDAITLIL